MYTSAEGIAFLERHEGVVLKAYRDPVGVWTIGAGLTRNSGVISPKAGMKLTHDEASRLLAKALAGNYEPRVAKAMPGAKQHEFDGGVSFDYNLGRIHNASWVAAWRAKSWDAVEKGIKAYRKAGGRVLPGLVRRRQEEFDLISHGVYEGVPDKRVNVLLSRVVVPVTNAEMAEIRAGFARMGYDPRSDTRGVSVGAVTRFQADHDLTVDGIIGRATLSTLQRRLDAQTKSRTTTTTTATGAATSGGAGATEVLSMEHSMWLTAGIVTVAFLFALYFAWTYRDVIAAKTQHRLPALARKLRSF
ncbi:MAG: glycoside hydrolase family protein [Pseudomonadota bacterium]